MADAQNPEKPRVSLISTVFPTTATAVFTTAVCLGTLLIFVPLLASFWLPIAPYRGNLIICLGVALVLGAFGAQATVTIGGVILAGTVAIAFAFYQLLQLEYQKEQDAVKVAYVRGTIYNVNSAEYLPRVVFNHQILGAPNKSEPQFEFVVFKDDITTDTATIELTKKGSDAPVQIPLPSKCFSAELGKGRYLEWEFKPNNQAIWSRTANSELGRFGEPKKESACSSASASYRNPTWIGVLAKLSPVSEAMAQAGKDASPELLVEQLKSDDSFTRTNARDRIAALPLESLRPVLDAFQREFETYRVKLGICVGLAQMLRADKSKAGKLAGVLTAADRDRLLEAASDPDRTVRVYAGEFLFDLADSETPGRALARAVEAKDDDVRYQLIFLSQTGWEKLNGDQRQKLQSALDQLATTSGQKTKSLIAKFK